MDILVDMDVRRTWPALASICTPWEFSVPKRFRKRSKPSGAIGYLVATLVLTCLLLTLNIPFVRFLHVMLIQEWRVLGDPKFTQLMMLIGPLVLLVIEWWVVDSVVHRLQGEPRG